MPDNEIASVGEGSADRKLAAATIKRAAIQGNEPRIDERPCSHKLGSIRQAEGAIVSGEAGQRALIAGMTCDGDLRVRTVQHEERIHADLPYATVGIFQQ